MLFVQKHFIFYFFHTHCFLFPFVVGHDFHNYLCNKALKSPNCILCETFHHLQYCCWSDTQQIKLWWLLFCYELPIILYLFQWVISLKKITVTIQWQCRTRIHINILHQIQVITAAGRAVRAVTDPWRNTSVSSVSCQTPRVWQRCSSSVTTTKVLLQHCDHKMTVWERKH